MSQAERIVVVGAGLAGLRAAERLRELGFNGELVMVGSERVAPYHRPALSKQLLMGNMRPNDLMLPAYRDIGAKWRLGTQAAYLLPRNRIVRLPGAEELSYDGLIIATGVEAKRPNNVPYHDNRIVLMRTLSDALELERALGAHRGPVAVVGGGFTGCEIAASLRHLGRDVTIIGRGKNLLGNVLGPKLGEWLTRTHSEHGVDLALGNSVKQWAPGPDGIALQLTDGSTMVAACVVIAAGTEPCTTWLRGSGLPLDNGVVCEPTCHVVGAEDVVAAGDVAQWPNLRFDEVPRRIEHWLNAVEMGRAAAESLLAGRAGAKPFTPMPRFWTEQYGVRIQAAGVPKLGDDTMSLGTAGAGTGELVGYVKDGRLMGVVGVDCPASVLSWTDSVCEQNPVPGEEREPAPAVAAEQDAVAVGGGKGRRTGRHAIPAEAKRSRTDRSSRSNGRIKPLDTSERLRPVEPAESPATNGQPVAASTGTRVTPVPPPTNGHLHPAAASNPRMHPANTFSGQLHPAATNGHPHPAAASNPRMRPAAASNGHPHPAAASDLRMHPATATNGHLASYGIPTHPVATNGRMRPPSPADTESTTRIPVVGADGRPAPMDTHGRLRPADVSMRFRPVPNAWPAGGPDVTTQLPPLDANGHPRLPQPQQQQPLDATGRIPVVDTYGRIRPVDASGRFLPLPNP
ncbi:MAG TPA: FAD-dependent oxidoreductase [Actinophytocola sp.]|uniref:NAD(P)/FAD-dependent oxidoreductase n=1 Tax=Actinophytocola sp. TaxID=1872138 RepID=UPI002DB798B1|nr:FAD-dependent oxidoreductase [Actinophytocola sp.]HEU5471616.1 FAD-dependent oxidoreductase [Actinophytocola sp.]